MNPDQMRDLFISEARGRLDEVSELLQQFGEPGPAREERRELMRHFHSLKGMAATMGYQPIIQLAHTLEDLLDGEQVAQHPQALPWSRWIEESLNCLRTLIDSVELGEVITHAQAEQLAVEIRTETAQILSGLDSSVGEIDQRQPGASDQSNQAEGAWCVADHPEAGNSPAQVQAPLHAYQLALALTSRQPGTTDPGIRVLSNLAALGRVVRVYPPKLAIDTGEFDRQLEITLESEFEESSLSDVLRCVEGIASFDLVEIEATLAPEQRDAPPTGAWVRVPAKSLDLALEQSLATISHLHALRGEDSNESWERSLQAARSVYERLVALRLVPFETARPRLEQTVRRLSEELDRPAAFALTGADTPIDRSLLEALHDPLNHILRNALDHGIEDQATRRRDVKPAVATITLGVQRRGERIRIEISDDGRGMNSDKIRMRAVEKGWLDLEQAHRLSLGETLMLVTLPGFSTTDQVTSISGRGFGMDIVRAAVERLGGRMEIVSSVGAGTMISLELPLQQSLLKLTLVRSAGQTFAVPTGSVSKVLAIDASRDLLTEDERPFPVKHLDIELELSRREPEGAGTCALIVGAGAQQYALVVDEVIEERESVVRPLGAPLNRMRRYAGAAIREDGSVLLVIDPFPRD